MAQSGANSGSFGQPGRKGGRKPGIPNKLTTDVKAMILQALEGAGGAAYLQEQALVSPAAFLTLVGKVLPMQVTGEGGGAITIIVKTGVPE